MENEQTSVPLFVANTVLTANQQNLSAGTGVPVFATTVTRDAAFGGSNKALAEGQLCYLSSTNVLQYYDGAAWATVGPTSSGLSLISATTIGSAVSSVTVSSAFSATYDNYKVIVSGGASSVNCFLRLTLGATATGYYAGIWDFNYLAGTGATGQANTAFWLFGNGTADGLSASGEIVQPFLSDQTTFNSVAPSQFVTGEQRIAGGYLTNTTSYTAFTITPSVGTLTGGTIRVYGYANS
jgi:hypothetical protein